MRTFEALRYAFSWSLRDLLLCISVVEHQKKQLGKPDSKSMVSWHTRFSTGKKNPPLHQSLPVRKCNTGFVWPLFLACRLLLQLNAIMVVQKDKHIYVQTCKQTHIHFRKQFQETRCAWFFKKACLM